MTSTKTKPDKTVVIHLPKVLAVLCAVAFIACFAIGGFFMYKASEAITSTTLLCADRLLEDSKKSRALEQTNITLERENVYNRGRLDAFEKLYGLSRGEHQSIGGD